jgi:cation transport regulator ChaB
MPVGEEDLPSTLERSPKKVRDAYEKTLESALEEYGGDEARAHRVAWAAVKHIAEKKGDRWVLKDEYGPSDPRARQSGRAAREGRGRTFEGVNANKPKRELYEDAKRAGIEGRSRMTKEQLAEALAKEYRRETARSRS